MIVVGLTGGIGSGKSHVAGLFCALGAGVIDADMLGHRVLEIPHVKKRLGEEFGAGVFNEKGEIVRKQLARIVFGNSSDSQFRLGRLESVTHPEIGKLVEIEIDQFRRQQVPLVILDAPVMFKSGWDRLCNKIVFVDANLPLRLERARGRGWSDDELMRRESRQLPIEEKRQRATDVIDNNRPDEPEWLEAQVRDLWERWEVDKH